MLVNGVYCALSMTSASLRPSLIPHTMYPATILLVLPTTVVKHRNAPPPTIVTTPSHFGSAPSTNPTGSVPTQLLFSQVSR